MRLLVPSVLTLSLALGLACAGGGTAPTTSAPAPAEATPAPPPPPPAPTPAAAVVPTPPPAPPAPAGPWACCDNERVKLVLDAYLDLQKALAKDDNRKAGGELSALQGAADSAKSKGGLDAESLKLVQTIRDEAHTALLAKDIETRRAQFKKISVAMIPFLKLHKGGSRNVTEAYCPMAEAGWVQEGTTIANPYYGSSMLTCGSFK